MCDDKIEFINVAFLLKDASIEVVYVKLPEVRAFERFDAPVHLSPQRNMPFFSLLPISP
jgi:hypothetical protein